MKDLPIQLYASLLIFYCLCSQTAIAKTVIRLAIGAYPPFTSSEDINSKILENVVSRAFMLEGIEVKFDYLIWVRSYLDSKNGSFPWQTSIEREQDFYIHKLALYTDAAVYFHLKSKPFDWNTVNDLKQYTVGVTLSYINQESYKEMKISTEVVDTETLNFKKLLAGTIDIYRTSLPAGYHTINMLFPIEIAEQFTHHPKTITHNGYYSLFSKKTGRGKILADKFDSDLKKLKAAGDYAKLIASPALNIRN